MEIQSIEMLKNASVIKEINKGFSLDQKYQVDDNYLVRIFHKATLKERKIEFETIQKLNSVTQNIPRALDFGTLQGEGYMVIDYLQGKDAESGMDELSNFEQFQAGFSAGEVLQKIHKADIEGPKINWFDFQQEKYFRKLKILKNSMMEISFLQETEDFIEANLFLMRGRESRLQHGDFHPANIILNQHQFAGVIDFNRLEFGDPLFDLAKIGFFTTNSSITFAKGNILGYLNEEEPAGFWKLFALYTAMHLVFALSWASEKDYRNLGKLIDYAKKAVDSHDNFRKLMPKWMTY
ncbi:aminoglycoside phosphotransferase [Listeria ivanovii]|uniref:aminoglycoside phosphotransferase family protein n=1 Tax=Listeria ivanovii TaxID=1638 RepID=UPI000DA9DA13|nr:phosphotransferase [Listeria ivanovii]PZG39278.1 aminoglycoside phosphotransferase [Listeria ivanovii]